jgi:murein DD-endopeptidase MepM/ murein hydrolase activator NlpD
MKWPPLFQPHETSLAEQLDDAAHRLSEMDLALASIQAQWRKDFTRIEQLPVALPLRVDFKISSGFGVRSDPFNGLRAMHEGVDLIARHGSPVLATASGVVTRSGRAGAHGQMIEIRHAEGWVTRYAHLSRRLVAEGERVERGEVIGHLGNTGRSSGAHLHYELEHHGRILDPLRALGSLAWRR